MAWSGELSISFFRIPFPSLFTLNFPNFIQKSGNTNFPKFFSFLEVYLLCKFFALENTFESEEILETSS